MDIKEQLPRKYAQDGIFLFIYWESLLLDIKNNTDFEGKIHFIIHYYIFTFQLKERKTGESINYKKKTTLAFSLSDSENNIPLKVNLS